MADIKIDSPFDFDLFIDRILLESKSVPGHQSKEALRKFAITCFQYGFEAGKLPQNRPINLKDMK